jgi:3-phenylpropionate/trans-cinnamate dioxygenase ferredoxin subunit
MAEYVKIASCEEIPVGKIKPFVVGQTRMVICHLADGFYAVLDECSHDYAPISTGRLKNHEMICPRHGARFDVRTGQVTAPPAVADIETFETKVKDGHVFVLIE